MSSYQKKQFIYKGILVIAFVACVTAVLTFYAATYSTADINLLSTTKQASDDPEENVDAISETLKGFRELVDQYYIGDIDEQKLMDSTIKGYIDGLGDEYSEYMTADEWNDYQASALGSYVGVGIYMMEDNDGNIVVVEPIEGSPAEEVGIKSNDIIVEIDGESVSEMDTTMAATKIKGEAGTKVHLKIARNSQFLEFDVERKEIKIFHVTNEMLDNHIGYIKLSTFDEGCANEFKSALEEVKQSGAQKLILDLRDNTGGLVDEALDIADMILPRGDTVLITVDAEESKEITIANQTPIVDDMDIVVLVNEYSASASEILVGALMDNEAATVVGTNTYGKGVIQNVFALEDGSILKLTTAEYYTPNGNKINKIGIKPDVEVEDNDETEEVDEALQEAIKVLNTAK